MSTDQNEKGVHWLSVIGKCMAFLSLHFADLRKQDLATQGRFLVELGLTREEAATMLGTTKASLTELMSRVNRRKGASRGKKK